MMATRDDGTVRFCLDCMQEVFLCRSDDDLAMHIRSNHCIAIIKPAKKRQEILLGLPEVRKKTA